MLIEEEGTCVECGKNSFLTDDIRGEAVYRNCGVVKKGKMMDFIKR